MVGGKNSPLAMSTIRNIESSLRRFYALACHDFAGEQPCVKGCHGLEEPYVPSPEADLTEAAVADGISHRAAP